MLLGSQAKCLQLSTHILDLRIPRNQLPFIVTIEFSPCRLKHFIYKSSACSMPSEDRLNLRCCRVHLCFNDCCRAENSNNTNCSTNLEGYLQISTQEQANQIPSSNRSIFVYYQPMHAPSSVSALECTVTTSRHLTIDQAALRTRRTRTCPRAAPREGPGRGYAWRPWAARPATGIACTAA